ncbi:glycosyltransferase [Sphingomonas sp. TREG-RG-20F-R18-01]|uniref:glycosyltransferase n=1 Tax=Sphingomonas sp. TREG-RG-20F-R18-01 TaxID=2914982 RepID=UPI001F59F8DC|nr:glycosyltransferase [Sphingomonas sp. TREG-RG-20F-R18-01]
MRIAIIHYWLVQMRGGERVLEHLCKMYPDADIFTHVVDRSAISSVILEHAIHTTFIDRLPLSRRHYQKYLPLMPRALELLDLNAYDMVISCEAGPAKGVITRPDAVHVTYCHSPMRYLWDQYAQYHAASGLGARLAMPLFAPSLRLWDMASAARPDRIMANSGYIKARIAKSWRRDATIVYPPVDTQLYAPGTDISDEYLWVGQLVPYKRPDLAIDAFNQSGRRLHVVGDGALLESLMARAGPTIRFTRHMDFASLRAAYASTRGLVFTAEEDFGLIPVEVMASGRPILAFRRGGTLETVVANETGLFFDEKSVESLLDGLDRFERWLPQFDPATAVRRATCFSPDRFRREFAAVVAAAWADRDHHAAP